MPFTPTKRSATVAISIAVVIIYLLSARFHIPLLYPIFGTTLMAFLPGYLLNESLGLNKHLGLNAKIGLSIVSSLVTMTFLLLLLKGSIGFLQSRYIIAVLAINLLLVVAYYFSDRQNKKSNPQSNLHLDRTTAIKLAIGLVPLLFFGIRLIVNPYLNDLDGATYIRVMILIERYHQDGSFLAGGRPGFSVLMVGFNYLTNIGFLSLFKYVLPGLTWLSLLSVFAFEDVTSKKGQKYFTLAMLMLLASPALIGQIDRFKPETLLYVVTVAITVLLGIFAVKKSYSSLVLAAFFVLTAMRVHDTGLVIALTFFVTILGIVLFNLPKIRPYITTRSLLIFLIVAFPYFAIFKPDILGIFSSLAHTVSIFNTGKFGFRLWFLNGYSSAGMQLGWAGWTFVLYYIFNGIFVAALGSYILYRYWKKNRPSPVIYFALINAFVYFSIAEILPRLGIYILPDRAWVDFFLNITTLAIIVIALSPEVSSQVLTKTIRALIVANVICSLALSIYLVSNSNGLASRQESGGINFIKGLRNDSVIISSQDINQTMIEFYTNKEFVSFTAESHPGQITSFDELQKFLIDNLNTGQIVHAEEFEATIGTNRVQTDTREVKVSKGGIFTLPISSDEKVTDNNNTTLLKGDFISSATPVYLIYSFAKANNTSQRISDRPYLDTTTNIDPKVFAAVPASQVVYRDSDLVVIKIR